MPGLTLCSAIDLIYVPNLHTLAACNKNSKANVCPAIKIVVALNTKTHILLNIFMLTKTKLIFFNVAISRCLTVKDIFYSKMKIIFCWCCCLSDNISHYHMAARPSHNFTTKISRKWKLFCTKSIFWISEICRAQAFLRSESKKNWNKYSVIKSNCDKYFISDNPKIQKIA